ncbi:MAG: glycosyltransferase family 4 protein [Verrucomicrobiales bacterium]|nr:glycosyltransferase family 4 protein [Verrucomicrobiales bacterium]
MAGTDQSLKVAIVHYHLRRGGVTRVIESAREALKGRGVELLILSGEEPRPEAGSESVRVIPALNYRKTGNADIAESLAEALKAEAQKHFGGQPDIWHFHNPTLAKNVLFPTAIRELANDGARIVLQLHDFAEDGRPGNYSAQRSFFDSESSFETTLYPMARQIHYATINHRDHDYLKSAGVPGSNLHVIPNAISPLRVNTKPEDRPFSEGKLFALYPTRGIRRKNLGELLLLALIFGDRIDFATTLSPENPEWKEVHDFWRAAAEELELPVTLGIADSGEYEFLDLIGWSDFIVTTSISEGFGLAFLEPWMANKCVFGRDLPDITRDFERNGLKITNLYPRIGFPMEWLDEKVLYSEIESMLRRSYLAYDCRMPRNAVKQTWKAWVGNGRIDFGVLNEELQLSVLRKVKENPELLEQMRVPTLSLCSEPEFKAARHTVETVYSLEGYGQRLEELYDRVASSPTSKVKHLATSKVLKQFLNPSRLNLLRN